MPKPTSASQYWLQTRSAFIAVVIVVVCYIYKPHLLKCHDGGHRGECSSVYILLYAGLYAGVYAFLWVATKIAVVNKRSE